VQPLAGDTIARTGPKIFCFSALSVRVPMKVLSLLIDDLPPFLLSQEGMGGFDESN